MKKIILAALVLASCAGPLAAEEGQAGKASWYGPGHIGKKTANGEIFTGRLRTAAHRDLPMGAVVRVLDKNTGRSVVVRINDRGPYVEGRELDVSYAVAKKLGIDHRGTAKVRLELLEVP